MKQYSAKVVDKNGRKLNITEEAISMQLFEESLNNRNFYIININENNTRKGIFFTGNIKKSFLIDFCYNVYSLLDFGIDINEVFKILSEIYTENIEGEFIKEVRQSLKKGEKLSSAIKNSRYSAIFDDFFIGIIASGEQSGNLIDSFRLLNTYLKNNQRTKEKLLIASIYPIMLLIITFFAVHIFFMLLLPTISEIYKTMDFKPSFFIQILFFISDLLNKNIFIYFVILGSFIIGTIIFFRTKTSKIIIKSIVKKIPIISKVYFFTLKIRISFSLQILLKGGSSLEEALSKLSNIEKEEDIKKEIIRSLNSLKEGGGVRTSLSNIKVYNKKDLNIIEISDSISKSPEGFEKIYSDTEYKLESYMTRIFELLNPVILLILGAFIGFIMYLIISPNIQVIQKFQ